MVKVKNSTNGSAGCKAVRRALVSVYVDGMAEFTAEASSLTFSFKAACNAAKNGSRELVETWLASQQGDVNTKSEVKGSTLLSWACFGGQVSIADWLIQEKGADKDAVENNGWTIFHNACVSGTTEMVQYLVDQQGFDPCSSMKDHEGYTPLRLAVKYGRGEVANFLLSRRAGAGEGQAAAAAAGEQGGPALGWPPTAAEALKAAGAGVLPVVKAWVAAGGDPARPVRGGGGGATLLTAACRRGRAGVARFLVGELGVPADAAVGPWRRTPLSCALAGDHLALAAWLRGAAPAAAAAPAAPAAAAPAAAAAAAGDEGEEGPGPGVPVDREAARAAAERGHLPYLQDYLRRPGTSVLDRPGGGGGGGGGEEEGGGRGWGLTFLHYAAIGGRLAVAQWLVREAGAAVTGEDDETEPSPVSFACEFDSWEVAEWLILHGGAAHVEYEPALRGAIKGKLVVVQAFVRRVVNTRSPLDNSAVQQLRTLIQKATENGHTDIVTWMSREVPVLAGQEGEGKSGDQEASHTVSVPVADGMYDGFSDEDSSSEEEKSVEGNSSSDDESEHDDDEDSEGDY